MQKNTIIELELPKQLPEIELIPQPETQNKTVFNNIFTAKQKIDTKQTNKLIFVSSPLKAYEKYTMEDNIIRAKKYCRDLLLKHQNCIAPHLLYTQILNDEDFYERKLGLKYSLELLERCDEMNCYILDGYVSSGMDKELELAIKLKIKINKIHIKGDFNL